MGKFLQHEPCPECGSRDNLARYDDGSGYCFGCNHYEPPTSLQLRFHEPQSTASAVLAIPPTASSELGEPAVQWLGKYGLGVLDAQRANLKWINDKQQLLYPFRDAYGKLCCIQTRNFRPNEPKYLGRGSTAEACEVYQKTGASFGIRDTHRVVITEDALSALKVSKVVDAMPALGVNMPFQKLVDLRMRGYQEVIVWLDRDKWKEAREISDRVKWMGLASTTVLSDLDPKCYTVEEIQGYLK